MNEIATTEDRPRVPVTAGNNVAGLIPQSIDEAFRVATAVSRAGMAPYGMDTPEKCLIAIMAGAEVGLPPMQAVQNIAVINNRPSMWGDALIGVVRASGFALYIKEWIEGEDDNRVAYCETHRKGEKEPVTKSFSVAQAKKAGLWQTEARVSKRSKSGGTYETDNDSPWWKYPERMLQMRSRAICLRDVYADVLKGLQVREEIEDYEVHRGPDRAKDVTPSASAQKYLGASTAASEAQEKGAGFNTDLVDKEIETLSGGAAQSADGETGGGSLASGEPSPIIQVWESLTEILDMDEYTGSDNPSGYARKRAGVVMGRLQNTILTNASPEIHEKAKSVLEAFHAVVDGKQELDRADEWVREMEDL